MRHQESKIQIACVNWFGYQYPQLHAVFYSVPNGGKRTLTEAKILKAEGVKAGVADLILNFPNKDFTFLAIEMKTENGKQTTNQKNWQKEIEKLGAKYVLCRNITEFITEINNYLESTRFGFKKLSNKIQ